MKEGNDDKPSSRTVKNFAYKRSCLLQKDLKVDQKPEIDMGYMLIHTGTRWNSFWVPINAIVQLHFYGVVSSGS